MPTRQYKTIFLKDIDRYPDWQIRSTFTESARILVCERSHQPIDRCENVECASLRTHITRSRVTQVEKAIIEKTDM